ncbi:hypothetical protein TVAG_387620 [Trichomonas vaginalis G3]|uniref:Uncharacterized protein n=1 Tax=Trichomonas vaginalis (strain ATCC PRA-98 / G3) TaxID=412133 RepID=A2E0Y9_TRIV3|nr:homeodomain-like family [Trichomonas vaginalis G3]EAY13621.1 hypothetical protein TVAG_387620 [Trichomonas vaginalis G3]KAI5529888.1 homeodomain-like family [Trichomonas vaginalis G3]|eukprot:XP_001325844.1 hypothetical protein [Trichomonas vaginalis G3]
MESEQDQYTRDMNISRHLSSAEKQSIIDLFNNNLSYSRIAQIHSITNRRVKEIIREYKKGRTTNFTKEQEDELITLYNQGKNSVKLLRPHFPFISCYAIRNKIKLFIRWGLIQPSGSFTANASSFNIKEKKINEDSRNMTDNICEINDVIDPNQKPDFCEFLEFVDVDTQ